MTSMHRRLLCVGYTSLFTAVAAAASAQVRPVAPVRGTIDFLGGDAASGSVVTGAPYSGEGVTTVTQTLGDGTRIERRVTAKFYRDLAGRVRREQTILGLAALNPVAESQTVVTISDPVAGTVYSLNPSAREAQRIAVFVRPGMALPPPPPPPPPLPPGFGALATAPLTPKQESLGTRQIEGVTATGRKTTSIIPAGQIGNDRPIEITDERWESPDLKVLVLSRHHDPQTGDVEYRLTNISRAEPSPDLFMVPTDYTILEGGPSRAPVPAQPARPVRP